MSISSRNSHPFHDQPNVDHNQQVRNSPRVKISVKETLVHEIDVKFNERQQTSPQMRVDAHITSSPTQALALAVRDVLLRLGVLVMLRHAEV